MLPPSADPKGDGEALAASLGNGDWQRQTIEEMRQEIRRIASEHEANWLRQLQQGQSLLTPSGFPSGNWFPSPSVLQPSNCTSAVDQWLETVKSAAVHSFAQVSGSEAPTAFGGANFGALSLQQLSSLQENPVGAAQQQHGFPTWQASLGLNVARNSLAPKQEYHEAKGKPIRQEHNLQVESEYDDEQYHSSEGDNNGSALERPARNTMDALSSLPPEKVKTLLSAGVRIKGRTPTELLEKATHVRQRRRESAARSRARRAQHFSELEGVNQQLREENQRLKALLNAIEHSNTARLQRKE